MKKPLKIILIILAVLVGLVAALLIWLTATQLNVKTETAVVTHGENSTASFAPGDSVSILTWNVGYAGLGEESDFFMDGGKQVRAPSKAIVEKNMDGIVSTVKELDADFTFLQEIEADPSTRSYGIEEAERMRTETGLDTAHARNYKCAFVPYPIPPIGKVSSGIMTLSTAPIASAERTALPSPFKWPVSVANLKRCLMPVYIDLEGTDAQLVLVNLHLEAYDDGEGKAAQTAARSPRSSARTISCTSSVRCAPRRSISPYIAPVGQAMSGLQRTHQQAGSAGSCVKCSPRPSTRVVAPRTQ